MSTVQVVHVIRSSVIYVILAFSFQMKRHRDYGAKAVYEAEHGVCQECYFNAHEFFMRVKQVLVLHLY